MNDAPSAREALSQTIEDHQKVPAPIDVKTTDGIHRALEANAAGLYALADYIDDKFNSNRPEEKPNGKDNRKSA